MKKIKGFFLIIALVSNAYLLFAQPKKDTSKIQGLKSILKVQVDLNLRAGIEWEQKIGRRSVIDLFGGLSIGRATDNYGDITARLITTPDAYAEYRNYYNLEKRFLSQKKVRNNSADYLFGRVEAYFPTSENYLGLLFIQGWGAQRSLGKRFNIDFHLGVTEHFFYDAPPYGGFNDMRFEPAIECSFSYLF